MNEECERLPLNWILPRILKVCTVCQHNERWFWRKEIVMNIYHTERKHSENLTKTYSFSPCLERADTNSSMYQSVSSPLVATFGLILSPIILLLNILVIADIKAEKRTAKEHLHRAFQHGHFRPSNRYCNIAFLGNYLHSTSLQKNFFWANLRYSSPSFNLNNLHVVLLPLPPKNYCVGTVCGHTQVEGLQSYCDQESS